jgi:hypothetical protein
MRDLHIATAQLAHKLHVVIARDSERVAGSNHAHNESQDLGNARAAIDQIAEKDRLPTRWMQPHALVVHVAQRPQKLDQLVAATMNVADDVEWSVVCLPVVPEWLARDRYGIDLLGRSKHVQLPKALTLQIAQRAMQLASLLSNHMRAEHTIGARAIPLATDVLRKIEHDRNGQHMIAPGKLDKRLSGLSLYVRRVNHGK